MSSHAYVWTAVVCVGLLTFVLRWSFIALIDSLEMPVAVHRALRFVPAAVLAAIILPAVVVQDGAIALSASNLRLFAAAAAAVVRAAPPPDVVGGTAARLGRDKPHPPHLVTAQLLLANPQCLNGTRHRSARQSPGFLKPCPKLDRLREAIDDMETAAFWLCDQHATTICAQIKGRIKFGRSGRNWRGAQSRRYIERARTFGTLWRHDCAFHIELPPR